MNDIIKMLNSANQEQKRLGFEKLGSNMIDEYTGLLMTNSCTGIFLCLEYGYEKVVFKHKSQTPALADLPLTKLSREYLTKVFELYCTKEEICQQIKEVQKDMQKLMKIQDKYEKSVREQGTTEVVNKEFDLYPFHEVQVSQATTSL
ncbi:hypothetical protein [uncultured Microscilla sp.]|uniref:hypothetical protein n=1 Tax=uncultured Microscilla sp. TaxID=432653 RepID=UPI0026279BDE|nr:hypothetical protein [uncultured Microscilla sp.]